MPEVLFTTWHEDAPVAAMLDAFASFERSVYEDEVRRHGLEAVAREEWENMCEPRSGWATTYEAAEERTGPLAGWHVVEIDLAIVTWALAKWLEVEA